MSTCVCRGVTVQYGSELVSDVTENRVADGDGGVVTKDGTVCTRKCGLRNRSLKRSHCDAGAIEVGENVGEHCLVPRNMWGVVRYASKGIA